MDTPRQPTSAEREASTWLVRLNAQDVTEQDWKQFYAWLEAAPSNQQAYDALRATWDQLDLLAPPVGLAARGHAPRRRWGTALAAAAITAFVVTGLATLYLRTQPTQQIAAAVGERRTETLPDGSTVALNADTRVAVHFTQDARRVRLQRGEALFDVRKEPDRPFTVETDFGSVRVLGTQFLVRLGADGARATVFRGEVEGVARPPPLAAQTARDRAGPVRAHAGEEISFVGATVTLTRLRPQVAERRLAWREGMLAFDGETLLEASDEITRQTGLRFEFTDAQIADMRIAGYIKANDADAFLHLLSENFQVKAQRVGDDRVLLSR